MMKAKGLPYYGGKLKLAKEIVSLFPHHKTYIEPFGGGASVLIEKRPSMKEIYNDLDEDITNFFRVLRDKEQREELKERLKFTEYGIGAFTDAVQYRDSEDPVLRAWSLLVRLLVGRVASRKSVSTSNFAVRHTSSAKVPYTWHNIIDAIAERFAQVIIEQSDAIELIKKRINTFKKDLPIVVYLDPPYLNSRQNYRFLYKEDDMVELIDYIKSIASSNVLIFISHKDNSILNEGLSDWRKVKNRGHLYRRSWY